MLEPEKYRKFYCQQTLSMSSQSNFTFCNLRSLGSARVERARKHVPLSEHPIMQPDILTGNVKVQFPCNFPSNI